MNKFPYMSLMTGTWEINKGETIMDFLFNNEGPLS